MLYVVGMDIRYSPVKSMSHIIWTTSVVAPTNYRCQTRQLLQILFKIVGNVIDAPAPPPRLFFFVCRVCCLFLNQAQPWRPRPPGLYLSVVLYISSKPYFLTVQRHYVVFLTDPSTLCLRFVHKRRTAARLHVEKEKRLPNGDNETEMTPVPHTWKRSAHLKHKQARLVCMTLLRSASDPFSSAGTRHSILFSRLGIEEATPRETASEWISASTL